MSMVNVFCWGSAAVGTSHAMLATCSPHQLPKPATADYGLQLIGILVTDLASDVGR